MNLATGSHFHIIRRNRPLCKADVTGGGNTHFVGKPCSKSRRKRKTTKKTTPRRRITVTSSLNLISMDQLGDRVEALLRPHPFLRQASGQIFKDDVNAFSSISDFCFMLQTFA